MQPTGGDRQERITRATQWRGDETETHEGPLTDIRARIPTFSRRPFRGIGHQSINRTRDVIVRVPDEVPIGDVSKQYRLVQHTDVFDLAVKAMKGTEIPPEEVTCSVTLTPYGERMALAFNLPDRYGLDLNGHGRLGLRLHCFNSVDGSTRFRALLGWFRFVCSNGLVVGTATFNVRRRHDVRLDVDDLGSAFQAGLKVATQERLMYSAWTQTEVRPEWIRKWVDGPLAEAWGKKAAARAYHIVETGHDAKFVNPFERAHPSVRRVEHGVAVPGSIVPAGNAFAVCQALAWIAKERRDVEEQLEWAAQIGDLMKALLKHVRSVPTRSAQLGLL